MNILFLTIARITSFKDSGIYTDLLRKFQEEGHNVYVVNPVERREKLKTSLLIEEEGTILNIQTLNIQKTNLVEKGVGTLAIEYQFLNGIRKYFSNIKFDLVLYSTPPITFSKVINFVKRRDDAFAYLLLKDIFPQNAVDLKMLKKGGLLHQYFLKKEAQLYAISDAIGCMSEANQKFILNHHQKIKKDKVEVNPNTILPVSISYSEQEKRRIKQEFNLPEDKKIFVYGGNLGKPQGIDFLLETIEATKREDVYFVIIGTGTEYNRINNWFEKQMPPNAKLMKGLPKAAYNILLSACDVGLLFLHKDFTIPNFPSRLLSYLEIKIPVLAATDPNTDVGSVIEAAKCGYWVLSGNQEEMQRKINLLCDAEIYQSMKENAWTLLVNEYHVDRSYQLIINKVQHV